MGVAVSMYTMGSAGEEEGSAARRLPAGKKDSEPSKSGYDLAAKPRTPYESAKKNHRRP